MMGGVDIFWVESVVVYKYYIYIYAYLLVCLGMIFCCLVDVFFLKFFLK